MKTSSVINNWTKLSESPFSILFAIVTFSIVIALGTLAGIRKGFRGAIISLSINLVSFATSIWVGSILADATVMAISKHNAAQGFDTDLLKPLFTGIYMLATMLVLLIVNLLVGIFLSTFIKRPIKKRKNENQSVYLYRTLGGITSAIGYFPLAVFATNATGLVSYNNAIININNKVVNGISFDKAKGASLYTPGIIGLAHFNQDRSMIDSIQYIFSNFIKGEEQIVDNDGQSENIKRWEIVINSLEDVQLKYKVWLENIPKDKTNSDAFKKLKENIALFSETEESFLMFKSIVENYDFKAFFNITASIKEFFTKKMPGLQDKSIIDFLINEKKQYSYFEKQLQLIVPKGYEDLKLNAFTKNQKQVLIDLFLSKLGLLNFAKPYETTIQKGKNVPLYFGDKRPSEGSFQDQFTYIIYRLLDRIFEYYKA